MGRVYEYYLQNTILSMRFIQSREDINELANSSVTNPKLPKNHILTSPLEARQAVQQNRLKSSSNKEMY